MFIHICNIYSDIIELYRNLPKTIYSMELHGGCAIKWRKQKMVMHDTTLGFRLSREFKTRVSERSMELNMTAGEYLRFLVHKDLGDI